MAQSRLAVSTELLREVLHLPEDVLIVGVHYSLAAGAIDLIMEGPSVPDAERVVAIMHQQRTWMELQEWTV